LGYLGQQDTNSANQGNAQAQMDFQERMSNTAYQRQTKDMEAAGLNPMLAYMKGGGASTPSGAMATYQSPVTGAAQAATSAQIPSTIRSTQATAKQTGAQTEYLEGVQTELTKSQIQQVDVAVSKLKLELENMPKGLTMGRSVSQWNTEAIRYAVEKVKDESKLLGSRDQSEQVLQNQMRAYISKIKNETELGKLDLKAAEQMMNAGRLGKELEPFAKMLFSIMRAAR
jgi:hypothetical protein